MDFKERNYRFSEKLKHKYLYGRSEEYANVIFKIAQKGSKTDKTTEKNYKKEAELIVEMIYKGLL